MVRGLQQRLGRLARRNQQRLVLVQVREAQQRRAALRLAQDLARTAQGQVLARDLEAVRVLVHHLEARARGLGQRAGVEQDADTVQAAATDAAAQLVQLR